MIADSTLTSEAPYSNFNPKRATTLPCFSFNPFTAPTIVPIEPTLAKDMRKAETMAAVRSLKLSCLDFNEVQHGNEFIFEFVIPILTPSIIHKKEHTPVAVCPFSPLFHIRIQNFFDARVKLVDIDCWHGLIDKLIFFF